MLILAALGDFLPSADTEFEIFEAASLSGTFSSMVLPNLPDDLSWDSSDLYHRGVISVITALAILKGDVDDDGSVSNLDITPFIAALSIADEGAFLRQFPNGNYAAADIDMSGSPDNLDITPFIGLLAAAGSNATALPEPSSLACVVMVLMLGRRRFLKQWPCRGEG